MISWRALPGSLGLVIWLGCALSTSALADDEPQTVRYRVGGPSHQIEIRVDHYGVPHIYAQTIDDVFFGQGWNAARDRLWQLDLWRRRGDGTLAEAFGPSFVEKDRAARLFLYRGDMRTEWLSYGSDTKRIVRAFVAGINAYIALTKRQPELLPFEFRELDYEPAPWTPETVVRIRSHGLLWNSVSEVSRARFVRDHGADALKLRERLEPSHALAIPEGLDLAALPDDALAVYSLAKSRVRFTRTPEGTIELGLHDAADNSRDELARTGSNNWAVAPSRTATGRPIVANDPHRTVAVPSLRYVAHLSAPGLDVIGAGEPALPGISIGHNSQAAFGLTIFFVDQEDVYVYETRPDRPDEYRYRGRWEPMTTIAEAIAVRDGEPVEVALRFTRHGPVVYEDADRHLAIAVRAAWLEPGMAPYLSSLEVMRAKSWDAFVAGMNRWGLPPENLVYADVHGDIGWKPGALVPIRPNWDGLLPVPGDGRYEWAGFLDGDELPVDANPKRGWVATANQMNLPSDYPSVVGFEWIMPYRYQRIREALKGTKRASVADLVALQTDYRSITARRVVATLSGITSSDSSVERALSLLRQWDGDLAPTSAVAALYEIWFRRHLSQAVVANQIDDPGTRRALLDEGDLFDVFEGGSVEAILTLLEDASAWRGSGAAREAALVTSLSAAIDETEELLGEDWNTWQWGRLHRSKLMHPLSPLVAKERRAAIDVGPAPRGGSGDTVNSTGYRLSDFVQLYGASFRMVVDVGNWDESVFMNSPGQSGDPKNPHYRDLFEPWASDETLPLLFDRGRIEQATERRFVLEPEATP